MSRERTPPDAGIEGCEACDVDANEWAVCTGRPGCVQKGGVEPGVDTPATSGADIVRRLRGTWIWSNGRDERLRNEAADEIARLRAEVERWRVIASENRDALAAMRNDINEIVPMQSEEADLLNGPELSVWCATVVAAVRAEVERLTEERGELLRENMAMVDAAMIADAADRPDRAALALRVAEAVREACKQAVTGTYGDARNHHRMDAIDLAAVVAGVTGEER